jgi:hypothetical protein
MWNGMNYLLKMPSDLDYLDDFKAIRKWMGFPMIRNPFAIPFPLEDGVEVFAGSNNVQANFNSLPLTCY